MPKRFPIVRLARRYMGLHQEKAAPVRFPKPVAITFDAYDTIYTPIDSVESQYHAIAVKYKVQMSKEAIRKKYRECYKELTLTHPNYGKTHGWSVEQFWTTLLERVFVNADLSQCGGTLPQAMLSELVEHFATRDAYRVFDDLKPCLQQLQRSGVHTMVASNADAGVTRLIIDTFELGEFFDQSSIFLSYDLEVSKPDPLFFEKILLKTRETDARLGRHSLKELLENSWHVGDEYKKDLECAQQAGMGAILLDRTGESGFLHPGETRRALNDRQIVINSLSELPKLFEL